MAKTATKKPAKKSAKKPAKKPTRKPTNKKPNTGQSGPAVEVPYEELNSKEQKVLRTLNGKGKGTREIVKIADLISAFGNKPAKKKRNSWVRNSLRRLVCGTWVEKVDRGEYRISEKGRKRLKNVKKK